MGSLPPTASRNVWKSHLNVSVVSSEISAQPKIQVSPWPVIPTKGANGMRYLFVRVLPQDRHEEMIKGRCTSVPQVLPR